MKNETLKKIIIGLVAVAVLLLTASMITVIVKNRLPTEHKHVEVVDKAVATTCTKSGLTAGTHCSECGEVLTAQETVSALGHDYEDGVCTRCGAEEGGAHEHIETAQAGKAATCTESGLTEGIYCRECGEVLTAQQVIPALGHTEQTVAGKAATCTESGLTAGKKCSVCGGIITEQEEIPALGHTEVTTEGQAATCTKAGYTESVTCSVCKSVIKAANPISALGHDYADGVCTRCGAEEDSGEHEHIETVQAAVAATCTEPGLNEGLYCSECGEVLTAQEEIPATGHTEYGVGGTAPTCTKKGWTAIILCSTCNKTLKDTESIPALGHTEETVAGKAATCTEPGLTEGKHCSVCNEILVVQEEIPALGHVEQTVAGQAATCTKVGMTDGVKCSVCGEILTAQQTIPALGHTEETVAGKAATCTETGMTDGAKCSVCGTIITAQQTIPALGHTEEVISGKAATCTETGLTNGKKCSVCNAILTTQQTISALGHNYVEGVCSRCDAEDPTYEPDYKNVESLPAFFMYPGENLYGSSKAMTVTDGAVIDVGVGSWSDYDNGIWNELEFTYAVGDLQSDLSVWQQIRYDDGTVSDSVSSITVTYELSEAFKTALNAKGAGFSYKTYSPIIDLETKGATGETPDIAGFFGSLITSTLGNIANWGEMLVAALAETSNQVVVTYNITMTSGRTQQITCYLNVHAVAV